MFWKVTLVASLGERAHNPLQLVKTLIIVLVDFLGLETYFIKNVTCSYALNTTLNRNVVERALINIKSY